MSTFTFFEGQERGDANPNFLYTQSGGAQQVTEEDLQNYFNDEGSDMLRQAFGSFENYLGYMTERESLIQSGAYDVGDWANADAGLTEDQQMLMEGEDLTVDASDAGQDVTNINRQVMGSQSAWYNNWANSEANQALLEKYGVGSTIHNSDGDTFRFNGSSYVKTDKVDDNINAGDIIKMAMMTMATAGLGNAIGGAMGISGSAAGGATLGGAAGSAASNMLATAIVQGAVTGSVDPRSLVSAGLAGGLEYLGDAFKAGNIAAGSDLGATLDNAVWELADQMGTDYDTVFDMAMGVASGAIQGQDLEEIALGALQTYTTAEVQDFVRTNFADSMGNMQVDNLFDEGEATIPIRAFDSFIETAVGAAYGDDVDAQDIARDFLDFATYDDPDSVDAEGTLSFLDPNLELPDLGSSGLESPFDLGFIEDAVREAGSAIDDTLIQPVREPVEAVAEAVGDVGSAIDDRVLQPIREALPHGQSPDWDPNADLPDVDINLPDVDLPDVDLPDVDLPSGGMLGGGGGRAPQAKDFYSGISYEGLNRPTVAPVATDATNSGLLNEFIARNLGGSLFKGTNV